MNETTLIHADIFFFITTITVGVIGILLAIAIIYLIKVIRDIDKLQKRVSVQTGELIEDIKVVRNEVASEGAVVKHVFSLIVRLLSRSARRIKRFKK